MLKVWKGSLVVALVLSLLATTATFAQYADSSTVQVATNATLGQILTDGNGMTLYVFAKDAPGVSNCTGGCLAAWPALTVQVGTAPTAGSGAAGTLGTITRSDNGQLQVTYDNKPLYHFGSDTAAGDISGEGVAGVWYAVSPGGNPVMPPGAAAASVSATAMMTTTAMQTTTLAAMATPMITATIEVTTNATLGQFLTDSNGLTLYTFASDTPGVSACTGQCIIAWPALTAPSGAAPAAGAGITGTLGTITRSDNGASQVTYNGRPLYHFASDTGPGDTSGQGVGGVWFVAKP